MYPHNPTTGSRKLAKNPSQAQSAFHTHLLNAVGQAVIATDLDGTITYWNCAAERLYGWSSGEVLGRNIIDVTPALTAHEQAAQIMEMLRAGQSWTGEFLVQRSDGSVFPAQVTNTPIYDNAGEMVGIAGISCDITAQIEARERAREAAQYNQAIMDRSLDVICIVDKEGRFVQVSAASERIWGYTPDELLGRRYQELVYTEDTAKTATVDQNLRQGRHLTHFKNRYIRKDGGLVDMMWSSNWSEEDQLFFAIGRDVTKMKERKRALAAGHAALRESEQRLQALVSATAQVVWTADKDGNATELSNEWTRLTGQTMADLNNEGWAEVLHPDDRNRVRDLWKKHLASKTAYEHAYRVRCVDGSYRWMHAREVPVFDPDGTFVEWVGACTDIDDRKQAESARRESEARYRAIVDTANEGVLLIDAAGKVTFVNTRMAEMVGFPAEKLQGLEFLDFIAEEDRDFIAAKFEQRWRGETDTYDVRFRRRDGSIRWVLASVSPFYDEAGTFAGSLSMVADITERKQAEEELKRSKRRYERLVQHIDGIVWEATSSLSTGSLAFNFISERLRDILGFEPEDWVADASCWTEAIHEEDRCWVPIACQNAVRAEQDHTMEYRMSTVDGQVVWIRDIVRIVERQGDRVIMAGLMLDITEQKQAEEALLKAKQEAEEMARLKSAFLTNMSHEIRTPLAGILGFAEIIADEAGGDVREYAEIIGQSGKRLKDTLNSVLDLARLESGSMKLAPEHFDVVQQIQQLLPIFERQTRDQKLYLRLEPETPQLFASLDRGAFSRILTNLISNGIKFTRQGGVTIRMGKGSGHIWVEVTDTGIGISETFRDRLFDEFQQESVGLTRSYEGTGLGLPIAKRLVELMEGTIEVESQKDVGTTFTVRLPSADRVEEMKD